MKSIKISETAHHELKMFAAKVQYNAGVLASEAILKYVKEENKKPKPIKSSKK